MSEDEPPTEFPTTEQLTSLVTLWAERLNLLHWRLSIRVEEELKADEDNEADAKVTVDEDYNVATVRLNSAWTEWKVEKLEHVIVHELLHCHLEPVWNAALQAQDALGSEAAEHWEGRLLHEMELSVDSLAHAIVSNWGTAPTRR